MADVRSQQQMGKITPVMPSQATGGALVKLRKLNRIGNFLKKK